MRRLTATVAWAVVLAMISPGSAAASGTAPGGLTGLLRTPTADTAGRGVFEFGVFSSFHSIEDLDLNPHYFWIQELQLGVGASPYLEVGAMLPVRTRWIDRQDESSGATSTTGFGDLVASGKLQLPLPGSYVRLGTFLSVTAPTGSESRGFSSGHTDFELGGVMTVDLADIEKFVPIRLHFAGGYRWNQNETDGLATKSLEDVASGGFWPPSYPAVPAGESSRWNDHVPVRGAIEFNTRVLDLFTEFSADILFDIDRLTFSDNFVFLTQGALIKFRNGMNLKLAADVSLQRDDHDPVVLDAPDWRLTAGFTWRSSLTLGDTDRDGVSNDKDECPDEAEDYDGFEDDDGCPDNDNDQDGVPDRDDLAPDLPEDFDGFEDDDGRPDLDNDGDGIADAQDECPNDPEDFDGDRDLDGCPDADRAPERQRPEEKPREDKPGRGTQPMRQGDGGSLSCCFDSSQRTSISCREASSSVRSRARSLSST